MGTPEATLWAVVVVVVSGVPWDSSSSRILVAAFSAVAAAVEGAGSLGASSSRTQTVTPAVAADCSAEAVTSRTQAGCSEAETSSSNSSSRITCSAVGTLVEVGCLAGVVVVEARMSSAEEAQVVV